MNTMFDYITHIKSVEYILALAAIAVFLVFNELLKAKPFGTAKAAWKDDAGYVKTNRTEVFNTIKKIATAPFIGLAYIVSLPFAMVYAVASELGKATAPAFSFGWRPVEAYLAGRKHKKAKK